MTEAALVDASKAGDAAAVRALLARGGVDVNTRQGWNERTPLLLAARYGHLEVMELLLAAGADANAADEGGSTALILAAAQNHPHAVAWLIQINVDLSAATVYGRTALHIAAKKGFVGIIQLLLAAPGADANIAVQNGHTPLHEACLYLKSEAVRVLGELGADLHATDSSGYTPMHRCILHHKFPELENTLETLQVLVSFGLTWDAGCEALIDDGVARKEAAALRVCVVAWTQEYADGLPFTQIPVDNIKRGPDDTRIYIDQLKRSKEVKHRRKICVVGPSKAGKTSLVKSLTSRQPSLEHPEDRTIGIDQIPLRFGVEEHGKHRIHEVTFWDFAGQNEYHVAHSLFFSARTLYLVCVDLEAFLVAFMQVDLMAYTAAQRQQLLNEFVERDILRWVRTIFSQQPDAEFVFVATKDDLLTEYPRFTDTVKTSLRTMLAQVEGIVREMQHELHKRAAEGERSADTLTLHAFQKRVDDRQRREQQVIPTVEAPSLQTRFLNLMSSMTGITLPVDASQNATALSADRISNEDCRAQKWEALFVSCTDAASVSSAREAITSIIVKSRRSFEMPDTYTNVLNAVVELRESTTVVNSERKVEQSFVPIDSLVKSLSLKAPEIDAATCRSIFATLHDLGDVLWYQDLGVDMFREVVILDPLLLIDFVRQVINHHQNSEMLAHAELQALPYWQAIHDPGRLLALKQVLQKFQLVHPSDGVMKWNSDLIVPSFWQSKTPASWLFGYEDVRLAADVHNQDPNKPEERVRVHWEYQFTHEFPDTLFDHLVVVTYSPYMDRDAGPDWILYAQDRVFACRAMVARNGKTLQRVLHLEAVLAEDAKASDLTELWEAFDCLSEGIVRVLRRYPGLVFTSVALDNDHNVKDLESLFGFPLKGRSHMWMPRVESWEAYKQLVRGHSEFSVN